MMNKLKVMTNFFCPFVGKLVLQFTLLWHQLLKYRYYSVWWDYKNGPQQSVQFEGDRCECNRCECKFHQGWKEWSILLGPMPKH